MADQNGSNKGSIVEIKGVVLDAVFPSRLPEINSALSIQTERAGHYTNFQGTVSAFEPCFPKKASVADAEALFAALAVREVEPA